MKKQVLFSAAMVAAMTASAQTGEITSNRGENWLSQSGDYGITFDATPLLNYAGNLFNGDSGNNIGQGLTWANPYFAIQGKKLIDANTAYRGKLRIGFGSMKETNLVDAAVQPVPAPIAPVQVEDVMKDSYMNVVLGAGLEKRIGSTRVVGVYGGEALIMFGNSKTVNEYGEALSADNTNGGAWRDTEAKNGSTFGIGVGVFGGIEWFCAPKVSLSGEYTWGLMLSSTGFGETTEERWNPATGTSGAVETRTIEDGTKRNNFSLDTGVSGASIGVNFYFQ
ncbi:MAG: hypothetical protein R2818_03780 [Flavobacteriales bacterium]